MAGGGALARGVIVVGAHGDAAAGAVVTLLRRRGRHAVLVDEVAVARAVLVHRPASGPVGGDARGTGAMSGDLLQLPDGSEIGPQSGLLVWRLDSFPVALLPEAHRDYAAAEGFAVGLSWLTGLGQVVLNLPDPTGLAGARVDLLRLHQLCGKNGLAMPAFELCTNQAVAGRAAAREWVWQPPGLPDPGAAVAATGPPLPRPVLRLGPVTATSTVLVLEGRVHGPSEVGADALAGLVGAAGLRCAEVSVGRTGDGPVITGLTPVPTLRGPGQLAAFTEYLERRLESRAEVAA